MKEMPLNWLKGKLLLSMKTGCMVYGLCCCTVDWSFKIVLLFFKDIDMVELGVTGCSEDQMQEESYFIRPSQHQENK